MQVTLLVAGITLMPKLDPVSVIDVALLTEPGDQAPDTGKERRRKQNARDDLPR